MSIYAGFACRNITPQHPCHMAGYNRKGLSTSVLDPIEVNSLSIRLNGSEFLITVLDSIMLEKEYCDRVRLEISQATGIPSEHIIAACIHTHSAPAFFKLAFEDTVVEPELRSIARDAMVDSSIDAYRHMRRANPVMEKVEINGLYGNRNVHGGPAVKTCYLIKFLGDDGTPFGAFFNISAHPTILNGSSRALSADLIGQIRLRLVDQFDCPVVCTNGTCGDVSTRFYRTSSDVDELMETADEIVRQLSERARSIPLRAAPMPQSAIVERQSTYDAKTDPDWHTMTERLENSKEERSDATAFLLDRQRIKSEQSPVALTLISLIFSLGNVIVVSLPGDVCSELGLRVKRAIPHHEVILIGYANAYCNYLVPAEDYGKYFETYNARTAKGVADSFIQEIIDTIESFEIES